jgi:RNA polymerase sigma-70 factor (ECF subfamily)
MEKSKDLYFDSIYRQSYRKVFNFARRLCGNHDQAEDLTQEAFVRAYRAIDLCNSGGKVDNWLMRIVYNLFLDARRRDSRRVKEIGEGFLDDDGMDQFSDFTSPVEHIVNQNSPDINLTRVLNSLDSNSRELLVMAFVENLPHRDIAERLGVKPGTINSRIHRLCAQLRRQTGSKLHAELGQSQDSPAMAA